MALDKGTTGRSPARPKPRKKTPAPVRGEGAAGKSTASRDAAAERARQRELDRQALIGVAPYQVKPWEQQVPFRPAIVPKPMQPVGPTRKGKRPDVLRQVKTSPRRVSMEDLATVAPVSSEARREIWRRTPKAERDAIRRGRRPAPPKPPDRGLLGDILALPGQVLPSVGVDRGGVHVRRPGLTDEAAAVGRATGDVARYVARHPLRSVELTSEALGLTDIARGMAPLFHPTGLMPTSTGKARERITPTSPLPDIEKLTKGYVGPATVEALKGGRVSPWVPLEVAGILPFGRGLKVAGAVAKAARAGEAGGSKAATAAFNTAMKGSLATTAEVNRAVNLPVLKSDERDAAHAAIDALYPKNKALANRAKAQVDAHVFLDVRDVDTSGMKSAEAAAAREEAARKGYADLTEVINRGAVDEPAPPVRAAPPTEIEPPAVIDPAPASPTGRVDAIKARDLDERAALGEPGSSPAERMLVVADVDSGGRTLFHGSPEGALDDIDTYRHTQTWEEGIGFYITESLEKAKTYANGRTSRGGRRERLAGREGAISFVRLKPDAVIMDMDAPYNEAFWRKLWKDTDPHTTDADFDQFILRHAGKDPTNGSVRHEVMLQLRDTHEHEAIYVLEEAYEANGIQATTHLEGKAPSTRHRVWVIKDADVLERYGAKTVSELERARVPAPRGTPLTPEEFIDELTTSATDARIAEIDAELDALRNDPSLWDETGEIRPEAAEIWRSLARQLQDAGGGDPPPPLRPVAAGGEEPPMRSIAELGADIREQVPVMERLRGRQEKGYSAERKRRLAAYEEARTAAGGGMAGHIAGLAALKGELPKLRFNGLDDKTFRQEELDEIEEYIDSHPAFSGDRMYAGISAKRAVQGIASGRVPTRSEIRSLEELFGVDEVVRIQEEVDAWRKWVAHSLNVINLPRALKASVDVSFAFRQGGIVALTHPTIWYGAWEPALRGTKHLNYKKGLEHFEGIQTEITIRQTYPLMKKGKVAFTGLGAMSEREEAFAYTTLADILPGIEHSQRMYTGFLNRLRADLFDHYLDLGIKQGVDVYNDDEFLRQIGKTVNMLTGRGATDSKAIEATMNFAATFLFAPRFMVSRLNLLFRALNPMTHLAWVGVGKASKRVARREASKGAAFYLGAVSGFLYLVDKVPGVDVGTNPYSSDFGKIRIGDLRWDMWGGFQGYVVLAARIVSGTKVAASTGEVTDLDTYGHTRVTSTVLDFLEGKLAPTPGFFRAWEKGRTPTGDEFGNPLERAPWLIAPIGLESFWETMDLPGNQGPPDQPDYGLREAVAEWALGAVGFGSQVFPDKAPKRRGGSGATADISGGGIYGGGGGGGSGAGIYGGGGGATGGGIYGG